MPTRSAYGASRLGYAGAVLFVATFGIENGFLGALLTFSGRPLYAAYLPTTAAWGLTPLEDQQIGGLGMWIPAGLIHLTTLRTSATPQPARFTLRQLSRDA